MTSRRAFVRGALAAIALRPVAAVAQETLVVDDWRATISAGVPPGWRPYETPMGRPKYDFAVVDDDGRRALRMRSASEHSTIAKELPIRLGVTPVLRWEWKVLTFPDGADLRDKKTSDTTGHLFVLWPRMPSMLRSRLIGYVWDPVLPIGTIILSRKTGTVTFIVARTGPPLRQWVSDERKVADDYRRVYGEEPEDPRAVALSIDTNDTRSTAEALFGKIAFVAR